jgi:hypothetical protein
MELNFTQLFMAGMFIEALMDTLKLVYDSEKRSGLNIDKLIGLIIAVLIAVLANIDFTSNFGLEISIPYVGAVLSGILLSRGGNYVHDIFKKFRPEGA